MVKSSASGPGVGSRSGIGLGGEDAFVARYLAPLGDGDPAALGLKDDAALLKPRDSHSLVMTCDTLIQDRHFLFDGSPARAGDVAHKALAVNVSDLVAKGATPRAYLMSLALPPGDFRVWMPAFVEALGECQRRWGLTLVGGDTVTTPERLEVTITAIGEVPDGQMVMRSTAEPGDGIYVSGDIGDAGLGLDFCTGGSGFGPMSASIGDAGCEVLVERYRRPSPRTGLSVGLRAYANAAIDVSDGFVRDLGRICTASDCGADVEANSVPVSQSARTLVEVGNVTLNDLFTGGDDYEIIACVRASAEADFVRAAIDAGECVTRVGRITHKGGVRVLGLDGAPMVFSKTGWDHLE